MIFSIVYILKWFIKYLDIRIKYLFEIINNILFEIKQLLTEKVEENKNKEKYEEYYVL